MVLPLAPKKSRHRACNFRKRIIGNFSASLHVITQYFGFDGFVTDMPDVSGYYEAVQNGAEIILMADDHTFLAHNIKNGKMANNQPCTGIIYAEIASRYLKADSKDVLVMGLGKVGFPGAAQLVQKGFRVYGYDPDARLLKRAVSNLGIIPFDPANPKKSFPLSSRRPHAQTRFLKLYFRRIACFPPQEFPAQFLKNLKINMMFNL